METPSASGQVFEEASKTSLEVCHAARAQGDYCVYLRRLGRVPTCSKEYVGRSADAWQALHKDMGQNPGDHREKFRGERPLWSYRMIMRKLGMADIVGGLGNGSWY